MGADVVTCEIPESPSKSFVGFEREYVSYGRGEGLVDSPRNPETGVFPPILPHRSAARGRQSRGDHRGDHRGFIGIAETLIVGGRYGA